LEELAKEQKRKASKRTKEFQEAGVDGCDTIGEQAETAASMLEFLENARSGKMIPPDVIMRYANYFKDDLTLDNMPRMQLINMCKYMGIAPYGADSFLRFQLRHRIRVLKEDDQRILWEGIGTLTKMELREACQERGMRSTGLSKEAYKRALQQWLDLSVNKDVPISLLIMSRTFFLREDMFEKENDESNSLAGLADAISGLDKEVLNEVILEVATSEEKRGDRDVRKIQLEVLSKQNELIRQEEQAREAAKKRDKEKSETKSEAQPGSPVIVKDVDASAMLGSTNISSPSDAAPAAETGIKVEETKVEDEFDLSAAEMDAISQLVSIDPVSKERAELQKIKAAMKSKTETPDEKQEGLQLEKLSSSVFAMENKPTDNSSTTTDSTFRSDEADHIAASTVQQVDHQVEAESRGSTSISFGTGGGDTTSVDTDDPVVARLKKKIESMVDKIELQLSETEVKIGDKLHFLDKDRDGILSLVEMADALRQVLKRNITMEEALEIANEIVSQAIAGDTNC
jgi:hypothetical protein